MNEYNKVLKKDMKPVRIEPANYEAAQIIAQSSRLSVTQVINALIEEALLGRDE